MRVCRGTLQQDGRPAAESMQDSFSYMKHASEHKLEFDQAHLFLTIQFSCVEHCLHSIIRITACCNQTKTKLANRHVQRMLKTHAATCSDYCWHLVAHQSCGVSNVNLNSTNDKRRAGCMSTYSRVACFVNRPRPAYVSHTLSLFLIDQASIVDPAI